MTEPLELISIQELRPSWSTHGAPGITSESAPALPFHRTHCRCDWEDQAALLAGQ